MERDGYHRALVRHEGGLHLEVIPTEIPGPKGLLIALSFVGICGTDLQILNGSRPDSAEVLGHEGVGVVVEAAPGATMHVGESVVFNPVAELSMGRILGHNVRGLFQQCIAVDASAVKQGLVLPVGDLVPPVCGALVEPLGAIMYAHELIARAVPRLQSAVVFGAGPIGLLAAAHLTGLGVRVLLVHPSQPRLDTVVALNLLGADSVASVSETQSEQILGYNGGCRFDAALICTTRQGAPLALRYAVAAVKSGGCIDMITNYPESSAPVDGLDSDAIRAVRASNVCGMPREGKYITVEMSGRCIAVTGHRGTSPSHLALAARSLQTNASQYACVITHVLPLSEAAAAIETLAGPGARFLHGRDCIKAVIDMR